MAYRRTEGGPAPVDLFDTTMWHGWPIVVAEEEWQPFGKPHWTLRWWLPLVMDVDVWLTAIP